MATTNEHIRSKWAITDRQDLSAEGGPLIITLRKSRQDRAGFWKVSSVEADVFVPLRQKAHVLRATSDKMVVSFRSRAHDAHALAEALRFAAVCADTAGDLAYDQEARVTLAMIPDLSDVAEGRVILDREEGRVLVTSYFESVDGADLSFLMAL